MLDEQVHLAHGMGGIPQAEYRHALGSRPLRALRRIGKLHRIDGRVRLEAQSKQRFDGLLRLACLQVDDQVDVGREPWIAVQHRGEATHHHVANPRLVQRGKDRFDDTHDLSVASIHSSPCAG